jgi:hypothetical protein
MILTCTMTSAKSCFALQTVHSSLFVLTQNLNSWSNESFTQWALAVPRSATSASHFFGVAAFSVGIPPVAFFIQSSMAQPQQFAAALRVALWLVWAAYVVVSQRLRHCLRQSLLTSVTPCVSIACVTSHVSVVLVLSLEVARTVAVFW